ncbi:MAG: hypothetical protein EBT95_00140 [Verrucomicrobia bacterium]|jgi:hypothetical protein|nr:hypothetical protein [Verrucomicrobiota bacterium]
MEERNDEYYNKEFIKMVLDSGYRTDKEDFVMEVLTSLYNYMSEKTSLAPERLTDYIQEVTKIVGAQHVQTLSVDEMVDWINWLLEQRNEK